MNLSPPLSIRALASSLAVSLAGVSFAQNGEQRGELPIPTGNVSLAAAAPLVLYTNPESAAFEQHRVYKVGLEAAQLGKPFGWSEYAEALLAAGDDVASDALMRLLEPAGNWDRAKAVASVVVSASQGNMPKELSPLQAKAKEVLESPMLGSFIAAPGFPSDVVMLIDISRVKEPATLSFTVKLTGCNVDGAPIGPENSSQHHSQSILLQQFNSPQPFRLFLINLAEKMPGPRPALVRAAISCMVEFGECSQTFKEAFSFRPIEGQDPGQHLYLDSGTHPDPVRVAELFMARFEMAEKMRGIEARRRASEEEAAHTELPDAERIELKGLKVGTTFPSLKVTNFDGQVEEVGEKVFAEREFTVVEIGFPQCLPCMSALGSLLEVQATPGMQVISLQVRRGFHHPQEGYQLLDQLESKLFAGEKAAALKQIPVYILPADAETTLSLREFPTFVIVDKHGVIRQTLSGGRVTPIMVRDTTPSVK